MLPVLLLVEGPVAEPLTRFLVQIVIILVLVRILGRLLKMIRQPIVIGEIIAGVLLGPSAFGQIPGFTAAIFPKESLGILAIVANIALIFFMFFLGLEVEIGLLTRAYKSALPTAILSILIPFACGAGIAQWVATMDDNKSADLGFTLFLGTAFSFTAFPVLARILSSNRMLASPLGIQALSCAAIDDVLAWCTLALALSLAQGGSALQGLYTALIAIGFILFLVFVVRPLFALAHKRRLAKKDELNKTFVATIFLMLCVSSWFAQIIGIHAFFGAFAFGIICVPKEGILHVELAHRLELLIVEFLLPLYFCNSGLSTDITRMDSGDAWGVLAAITALACVSKIIPSTLLTRLLTGIFGFGYGVKSIAQLEEERAAHPPEDTELTALKVEPAQSGATHPALSASTLPHSNESDVSSVAGLATTDGGVGSAKSEDAINGTNGSGINQTNGSGVAPAPNPQVVRFHVVEDGDEKADSATQQVVEENGIDVAAGPHVSFAPTPRGDSHAVSPPPSRAVSRKSADWCGLKRYEPADWNLCLALGMLMNTRGLVALIVLNIGLEKNILSVKVFTMMVLMSLITTLLTPPSLYVLFGREWSKQLAVQEQDERVHQAQIEAEKRLQEREMQEYINDRKQRLTDGSNGRLSTSGPYRPEWTAEHAADAALEPLISVSIAPYSASAMSFESPTSPRRKLSEWQQLRPDIFRPSGGESRVEASEAGADTPLSPPHFSPAPDGDEGISTASFWRAARSMSMDQHALAPHLRSFGPRRDSRLEASEQKSQQRIAEEEEQAEEGQVATEWNAQRPGRAVSATHKSPDDWMSQTAPAGMGKHNRPAFKQPPSR